MLYFYLRRHLLKINNKRLKSQDGFVLIAAIMAVMILIAVGFFALTVTMQDIRVSSRLVGERKAMSAAEAGVNEICRSFNPFNLAAISGQKIDNTNDPAAEFDTTAPVHNNDYPDLQIPGMPMGYKSQVFDTTVTGRDTSYGSEASIDAGIVTAPRGGDTQQGTN